LIVVTPARAVADNAPDGGLVVDRAGIDGLRRSLAEEVARLGVLRAGLVAALEEAERALEEAGTRRDASAAAQEAAEADVGAFRVLATDLAEGEASLTAAKERRSAAEQALVTARAELAAFEAGRGALEWALSDARASLERHRATGDAAPAGQGALMAEVARVEEVARRAAADRAEAQVVLDALTRGRDDEDKANRGLADLLDAQRARLAVLSIDDPEELRLAVAAYEEAARDRPPDATALSVAEQWAELDRRSAELDATEPGRPTAEELHRAQHRLEEANRMLAVEQEEARLAAISDDTRAAIEAAHDEATEAEEAVTGPFGSGPASRRLATAKEHLAAVLEQAGFASYLDYLVAGHTLDPRQDRKVIAGQNIVRRAEANLRALEDRAAPSAERLRIADERRTLLRLATESLGFSPTGRVEHLLRALPEVDPETTRRLVEALDSVGARPTDRSVLATATGWLAGWEEARQGRGRLEDELTALEHRLAAAQAPGARATWDDLVSAAAAAVERAAGRERHANRLATSLVETMKGQGGSAAPDHDLAAQVEALAGLRDQLDVRLRSAVDAATDALSAAVADAAAADAVVEAAEDALDPILGEDWTQPEVAARLVALIQQAHMATAAAATDQTAWEEATAARDMARRRLADHDAAAPSEIGADARPAAVAATAVGLARSTGATTVTLLDPFDVDEHEAGTVLDALAGAVLDALAVGRGITVVYATDSPSVLAAAGASVSMAAAAGDAMGAVVGEASGEVLEIDAVLGPVEGGSGPAARQHTQGKRRRR